MPIAADRRLFVSHSAAWNMHGRRTIWSKNHPYEVVRSEAKSKMGISSRHCQPSRSLLHRPKNQIRASTAGNACTQ
jgi:hypothetical protein